MRMEVIPLQIISEAISLSSPLAKVFESLTLKRMLKLISENKLINKKQFEFCELHSTNHILVDTF